MLDFPPWKTAAIWLVVVAGVLFSVPNFFSRAELERWPAFAPTNHLNLGLDLRGGSHILLEASPEEIRTVRLEVLRESAAQEMRTATGGAIPVDRVAVVGEAVEVVIRNAADVDRAVETLRRLTRPVGALSATRDFDVRVVDGTTVQMTPTGAGLAAETDSAMGTAVEVIRRRVDELGTREPSIVRQGDTRIVVQVPGLDDPDALKALIGTTARLEFRLVDLEADPAATAQGRPRPGSEVLPMAEGGNIAVQRRVILSGDNLVDSQPTFQDGQPVVSFRFDSAGGRRFARVTQENVGRPFAIVLDGTVISAPRINEPILGGSGIISGSFTTADANELAILLRSGRLPVALTVIEERTVGPDLGADSIRAGAIASVAAVVLTALFMIMTYGRFGVYSVVALGANCIILVGVLSAMGATLTLPGIAGFVLTIGAAVDANVLINERIREELRKGRPIISSVEAGYTQASRTIFDANITNIIASVIMFTFGSGPIRGFALVLTVGIITSVFTAVVLTRWMAARWLKAERPKAILI